MTVRSLNVDKNPFHMCKENKEVLVLKASYFNVIMVRIYLTNYTRHDISFIINLLEMLVHHQKNIGTG